MGYKYIEYKDGKEVTVKQKINEQHSWMLGDSMKRRISQSSVNKIDQNDWTITGISATTMSNLQLVLKCSKIYELKKQVGRTLSEDGKTGIAILVKDGKPYLQQMDVTYLETEMYEISYVEANTGKYYNEDGLEMSLPVSVAFEIDKRGRVIKKEFVTLEGNTKKVLSSFKYPKGIKRIPFVLMKNNADGLGDIDNVGMWDAIKQLNFFASDFGVEWSVSRTLWTDREAFADQDLESVVTDNSRFIKRKSIKSKLQEASEPISLGSQSILVLKEAIDFVEEKILEYTFTAKKSDSSGTNKFNKEISMFNQDASEYLEAKRMQRDSDYTELISKLIEVMSFLKLAVATEIDTIAVAINLSTLEEGIVKEAEGIEEQPTVNESEEEDE